MQLSAVDRASIKATDKFQIASKTMKNHRERLAEIIKFVQEKHPTHSRECVREISEECKNNDRHNWFEAKYDFIYEHLHSDIIKAFMAGKKLKHFKLPKSRKAQERAILNNPNRDVKLCSFEHVRKYHDAMLFGASQDNAILSSTYCIEMRKFLDDYKKEVASAKKEGKTDESAAEPFAFPSRALLATWFLKNMLLKHAWIAWLEGFPDYCDNDENNIISKPVEQLCNITPTMLPRKFSKKFRTSTLPIMKLMGSAPDVALTSATLITNEFVNESFWYGTNHVKIIVSYVFRMKISQSGKNIIFVT